MLNKIPLFLLLLVAYIWPACQSATIPTDYLTVDKWRRAGEADNWNAIKNAHDDCADSLSLGPLLRIVNWNTSLQMKSLQDLSLKIDDDNNGTHRFAVLNGAGDTVFRVNEDFTAKFFGALTVAGTVSAAGATSYPSLTASLPLALNASKEVVNWAVTGTGTALALSINPSFSGTLAAENGTYSGTLAGAAANFSGAVATAGLSATTGSFSSTLGVTGVFTNTALAGTGTRLTTSTSTGVQGNATSIDGANTWNGTQTFGASPLVEYSNPGGTVNLRVGNTSTAAGSMARVNLQVAGTAADDPIIRWDVALTTSWVAGIDNSVPGDPFRICPTGSLGSGSCFDMTTAGLFTAPTLAVTGAATAATMALGGNEAFDYNEDTFTGTLRGCASDPSGTLRYTRIGKIVTLYIPPLSCISDSSGAAITGLPAEIQPTRDQAFPLSFRENSTWLVPTTAACGLVVSGPAIRFYFGGYATFFAASNVRSLYSMQDPTFPTILTYTLQ